MRIMLIIIVLYWVAISALFTFGGYSAELIFGSIFAIHYFVIKLNKS